MSLPELVRTCDELDRGEAAELLDANEGRQLAGASKWSKRAGSQFTGMQKRLARRAKGGARRVVEIDPRSLAEELGIGGLTHG